MNHLHPRTLLVLSAVLIGAAALTGCSESPQQKYDSATNHLKDAKKALSEAKDKVDSKQEEIDKQEKKLRELQQTVDARRDKVVTATQAVDKTVNDEVLFRTLQKNLLDKDQFSDSAISVGVHNLVVTLSGVVPDQETHDQAIKVTRNQAGVADVRDKLQIGDQNNDGNAATQAQANNTDQSSAQSSDADSNDNASTQPPEAAPTPSKQDSESGQSDDQNNSQPPHKPSGGADSPNAT